MGPPLCTEGRVTVNGERCLDPASRVAPGTVVAVDPRGPKLRTGPLAESAIVFYDRDVVVVDKPVGILSTSSTRWPPEWCSAPWAWV
jgi:23S rRNA pseudouridine1911/1915/1917 synthase